MLNIELFYIILVSLSIGSFINFVIYRLTSNTRTTINSRSICPKCKNQLKWYHNIPIFSFLFLKGKCSFCKEKISLQYPLVEVFSVILAIIIYIKEDNTLNLTSIYIYFTFITLLTLSIIDIKTKIIPVFLSLIGLSFAIFSNENYIVSFIYAASMFLKGKCSFCKEKISLQYPLVEVFSVILAITIYIKEDNTLNLSSIYIYFTFITLLALSIIDIKTKIIPVFLSLIGLSFAIFSNENYIVSFIYAASMIGIFYLIRSFFEVILKKEILGEGDLIIFGIVGAILVEPTNIFSFLFLLGILSIIPSLYLIYKNKNKNILIDNRFDDLIKIVEKKSKQNENDFIYTKKITLLKEGLESFRIKDNLNSLPFVPFISLSLFIIYVGLKNI